MKKRGDDKHLEQPILDKYQTLLNEFLHLQKENVSKKRRLVIANQKRGVLLSQVRFLKRRLRHLKRNQYPSVIDQPNHIVHDQNTRLDSETRTGEANKHNDSTRKIATSSNSVCI